MLDRNMLARPAPIAVLLVLVALLLYWPTVVSLVRIWTNPNNPTYSHGLLLVAISVILCYRRWRKVPVEVDPSAWALVGLAGTSFVWFLAYLGHVQIVQQLSLLAVIGLLLWAVLGYRNAKQFAFPVLLLLFAMPLWDSLSVRLQYFTANAVNVLLNNTGFTAVLDDILILVPAGTFEVSTSCSGLAQFIVAMMVAALYSHVNELRFKNALLLGVIAMLVAIATNTLRIYIVVVAGQLTNMQHYFVTEDHWTLGWVLFGIGMFVFLLWANRYIGPEKKSGSKREAGPLLDLRVPNNPGLPSTGTGLRAAALALGALAVGPVLGHVYLGQGAPALAQGLAIPEEIGAWRAETVGAGHYRFHGADLEYDRLYRAADGANVYLYVAYYVHQQQGKEAVYYLNKVYDGRRWKRAGTGTRELPIAPSARLEVKETRIRSRDGKQKIVWQWYYVNGSRTGNDYTAKILNVLGTLRRDPSIAVVAVAASVNGSDQKARDQLGRFLSDALEALERGIDAAQSM